MGGTGVIDRFLEVFTRYIDSGFGLLGGEVAFIATTLIVIDITLAALFWSWGADEDIIARLVKKTLFVGVFAYIIGNWNALAKIVFESFAGLGLKASGTGQGGIWHLALAGLMNDTKLPATAIPWVPSNGAAPAMQDLVAGGVDVVTCSLPEARAMIDAGKAKPLAVMDTKPSGLFPNVPTMKQAAGSDWTVAAWRGIAGPKGLPKDVEQKLVATIRKIWDSKEFKDFATSKGYGTEWAAQADFAAYMAKGDRSMGEVMKALGLAK